MIQHGTILVPTDFSAQSDEAIRRACVLARAFQAEVHVYHVFEPIMVVDSELLPMPPMAEIEQGMRQGVEQRLQVQVEQARGEGVPVHGHLEECAGAPSRAICAFAERLPADLIVIGRHGRQGALEHLLIGSTAERVVRHAPCSVLVAMPHGLLETRRGKQEES